MKRTLGILLTAFGLILVSTHSLRAQLPTDPRELAAVLLKATKPPAELNEKQRAAFDKTVVALRESKAWTDESRAAFTEFAHSYLAGLDDAPVIPWVAHIVSEAFMDEETKKDLEEMAKFDLQKTYQDVTQAVQTLMAITKEMHEAAKVILNNLKG